MTIDWSKAPEGATHWNAQDGHFFRIGLGMSDYFSDADREWCDSPSFVNGRLTVDHLLPRPSEPKPYTRDEALQFLVERLDSWPTDIADAPLCPGWGWESGYGPIKQFTSAADGEKIFETSWNHASKEARGTFTPFVSVEDAQPATGQKFDTGKPIIGAIPPHAELAVARVMTFGAQKYARDNWRNIDDIPTRYMDAALRHLNAVRRGETVDPESGEHHLAHAACCILFMLDVVEASDAQTDR